MFFLDQIMIDWKEEGIERTIKVVLLGKRCISSTGEREVEDLTSVKYSLLPRYLPTENTENEVHDEEGSNNHHRDEVNPLPGISHRVFDLWTKVVAQ